MKKASGVFIVILFLLSSCKKNTQTTSDDLGYNYFPLKTGYVYTYQFDSIAFDDNTKSSDTFYFELTQIIDTFYVNTSGENVFLITQFVTDTTSKNTFQRPSFFVERNTRQLIFTENNAPIVKLVFPVGNVRNWNGNMLNSNFRQTFNLSQFNVSNGQHVICRVQESNNINAIEEDVAHTIYAQNIGIIEHYKRYLNKQASGTSGYIVHLKLKDYTL
ncbi:MAG: hypothetical protein ACK4K9_04660 [Bacteroidia bacterium]